ncbi:hypothetical protein OG607_28170 [Streptomyces sp. NBC_01537]|uniref:hypothetical protein n=1 Tax=Streptomyces sp. NBC_01537 TaxID=2903896 RepID=UPI00386D0344
MSGDHVDQAWPDDSYILARRRADDAAKLLCDVLVGLGIEVGVPEQWPDVKGRATFEGDALVYLGTVPVATIEKLTDALAGSRGDEGQNR